MLLCLRSPLIYLLSTEPIKLLSFWSPLIYLWGASPIPPVASVWCWGQGKPAVKSSTCSMSTCTTGSWSTAQGDVSTTATMSDARWLHVSEKCQTLQDSWWLYVISAEKLNTWLNLHRTAKQNLHCILKITSDARWVHVSEKCWTLQDSRLYLITLRE